MEYSEERNVERLCAVQSLKEALRNIGMEGRQPDLWERLSLIYGINALFRGLYRLADASAERAMVPEGERSKEILSSDLVGNYDLATLEEALRVAEAEPVRQHPHFGPVQIVGVA